MGGPRGGWGVLSVVLGCRLGSHGLNGLCSCRCGTGRYGVMRQRRDAPALWSRMRLAPHLQPPGAAGVVGGCRCLNP